MLLLQKTQVQSPELTLDGSQPPGTPTPQTQHALFWHVWVLHRCTHTYTQLYTLLKIKIMW